MAKNDNTLLFAGLAIAAGYYFFVVKPKTSAPATLITPGSPGTSLPGQTSPQLYAAKPAAANTFNASSMVSPVATLATGIANLFKPNAAAPVNVQTSNYIPPFSASLVDSGVMTPSYTPVDPNLAIPSVNSAVDNTWQNAASANVAQTAMIAGVNYSEI